MKTKNYIADFNAIVVAKFDFAEITLYYRNAHKEAGKSGAFYTMITEGTDFIAVGTDGNLKMFNNWDDAAEYAKALTGDYYVGVRPSGNVKYQVLAKCENKAETEVITEAAPAEVKAEAEVNNEKVVRYVNNNHCKGTKAIYKVESHKYASDTHRAHSVWIEYFFNYDQLKKCFHHNDYMDAEKFYVKDGRNWVEFNYDYEAEEKAILEKAEKIENIVEKLKAKKAEAEKVDNEVITEVETPTEAEDNNVYFTYNDIYEALNTILNAKSSKVQVELHEISEITDVPKSMCFFKEAFNCIGVNFINYCDADDPLAVSFRFPEEYLRNNINDIALELADSPFNDDPHPQTEDYEEAAPAESNNGLVEKVAEIVKKVKCREEINVSKEVCQKNGIDVSSWPVFVANLTKNSDNNYAVKVYIYNNACEILAKFNHDTGSKRWSEAIEYDVAAYIVDTLTEYVSQSEEYKKAEAEAVKALPF